jgi:predicted TPR repeat methyltransferase
VKSNFQSQRFYDAVAPDYDDIVGESSYADELEPILSSYATKIHRVLDVGAGTGKSIEGILECVRPDSIVAVDISGGMLDELKDKYPNVEVVHGDVLDYVETDPKPFDLITAFSVFELLWDLKTVLAALAHKLNPGGVFAFTYEPLLPDHPTQDSPETTYHVEGHPSLTYTMYRRRPERMRKWLRDNGLRIIEKHKVKNAYEREDGWVELRFIAAVSS